MRATISGLILANMSCVVYLGFQPIALECFARAREFVPFSSPDSCMPVRHKLIYNQQWQYTYHRAPVLLQLLRRKGRRLGVRCQAQLDHALGDTL